MKKSKALFVIPICMALLSGCNNIEIKYYKSNENASTSEPSQENNIIVEDFFEDITTTYTENVSSVTLQTLYEKCKKSTVTIETYVTYTRQGMTMSSILYSTGSGFIVNESENYLYIYTNAHVIDVSGSSVQRIETEVILSNHNRYSATIINKDTDEDVAILKINKPSSDSYIVADIADSSEVDVGESVFAIGSPLGINYSSTLTEGIISGVNIAEETDIDNDGEETTMYLLQTDTAINPGNSGGPLFNYNGQVIGVNTIKLVESESGTPVEGMGFAIPINHFKLVADTIIDGSSYSRPKIGITTASVAEMSLSYREQLSITVQTGMYIESVTNPDSALTKNTIITHINNKQISTFSDFASEIYNYNVGQTISITYCNLDGSNSTTVNVTLI